MILFVELLQQYVDVTGDVQTASWICVTFMPGELVQANEAAMSWMSSYRSLLSAWNMYKERALFDLACYTSQAIKQVMQQVRQLNTMFENHRKSLIEHYERSELRLHFDWTKKMPKMVNLAIF